MLTLLDATEDEICLIKCTSKRYSVKAGSHGNTGMRTKYKFCFKQQRPDIDAL